jgi:hypothetical protein
MSIDRVNPLWIHYPIAEVDEQLPYQPKSHASRPCYQHTCVKHPDDMASSCRHLAKPGLVQHLTTQATSSLLSLTQ